MHRLVSQPRNVRYGIPRRMCAQHQTQMTVHVRKLNRGMKQQSKQAKQQKRVRHDTRAPPLPNRRQAELDFVARCPTDRTLSIGGDARVGLGRRCDGPLLAGESPLASQLPCPPSTRPEPRHWHQASRSGQARQVRPTVPAARFVLWKQFYRSNIP